ncbi:binary toxin-like calcium binding domain-containing protein, partial [Bacillus cereus]|uniref:binary toxin-like calcium binding domain-containing protein n=1 Tax=Bacillus cereus TaxID=1396 RepID=UPI003100BE52
MDDKKEVNSKFLKAVGQFFYGENYNEPAFVVSRGNNGFKVDKDQLNEIELHKEVQSVRWITNFTPKISGVYKFEISPNLFAHILIDGKDVKNKEIQLEAHKMYRFIVAYFNNISVEQSTVFELEVKYEFNKQEIKELEIKNFSIPQIITFDDLPGTKTPLMLDTDGDGIYDEWEIEGYTVIKGVVKKWKDEYASLGFKKYVSNPYESHTAGDPYSDLEKASGAIDRTIKEVAWDPMVAAFPSITVGMESLILSNNKEIGSSQGKTASNTTSSSIGISNTEGGNLGISSSLEDFSVSGSMHYSQAATQTVDSSHTSGQEWSKQLS